jgi:hypothetical protein
MREKDIIKDESIIFECLLNKKWQEKCPDGIKRQAFKNSYENSGMKAPDIAALDCALKVKQYIKLFMEYFVSLNMNACFTHYQTIKTIPKFNLQNKH